MTDSTLPVSPFGSHCGVVITEREPGRCCGQVELQGHHRNSAGMVHGGLIATLADVIGGAAVIGQIPTEQYSATTDMTISYIRAAKSSCISGEAKAYYVGSKMARAEVNIFDDDLLIAKVHLTFMLVQRKR